MTELKQQPHLKLTTEHARPVALVCGDPGRAERLAKMCGSYKEVAYNREYRSFICTQDGIEFLVTSHGVGSAGAAICFNELIFIGVKTIIRIGTCGSLQPDRLKQGDLAICYAAAKQDGVSACLEPQGMPAVATPAVTAVLQKAAEAVGITASLEVTLTSDIFYPLQVENLKNFADAHCGVVEMEVSTLFTVCRRAKVNTGAIVVIDGCPFQWEAGDYDPHGTKVKDATANAIKITLAAVVELTKQALNDQKKDN